MKKNILTGILVAGVVFIASGCVVRTYEATNRRVDQDVSMGNRGFLMGTPSAAVDQKPTRQSRVVEMEFGYPFRFENRAAVDKTRDRDARSTGSDETIVEEKSGAVYAEGSEGYLMDSDMPESEARSIGSARSTGEDMQEYAVRDGDTLQKISLKFYGTTKKWQRIFEANNDRLKSPDKVYPGQVILIPLEQGMQKIK